MRSFAVRVLATCLLVAPGCGASSVDGAPSQATGSSVTSTTAGDFGTESLFPAGAGGAGEGGAASTTGASATQSTGSAPIDVVEGGNPTAASASGSASTGSGSNAAGSGGSTGASTADGGAGTTTGAGAGAGDAIGSGGASSTNGASSGSGNTTGSGAGLPTGSCTAFAPAGSTTSVVESGPLCSFTDPVQPALDTCNVLGPNHAVDQNSETYASFEYAHGALDQSLEGAVDLVVDLPTPVAAKKAIAFDVVFPSAALQAGVLDDLTVTTYLNGALQESRTGTQGLELDVLQSTVAGDPHALVGFVTSKAYDRVRLRVSSKVANPNVLESELRVFELCTDAEL